MVPALRSPHSGRLPVVTAIAGMTNGVTNQTLTVLNRPTVAKAFGVASMASRKRRGTRSPGCL